MNNLTSTDFYKPTPYNPETLNQIWMSEISDSHDIWCNCNGPFAHLLASIFPPGHKDRDLTINQIIKRDYKQACHSGGREEPSHGSGDGGNIERPIKEEDGLEDDADALLMAAAAAAAEENAR